MQRHLSLITATLIALVLLVGSVPAPARADGPYIYWLQQTGNTSIARMNLDGTEQNFAFVDINDDLVPWSLVSDGAHLYWTTFYGGIYGSSIGRVDIDGTNSNESYIALSGGQPRDLVIRGDYLYWTSRSSGQPSTIGRVKTDGSDLRESYISLSEGAKPNGLVIKGQYIYWTDDESGSIGRAKLNGSKKNENFVRHINDDGELMVFADLITVGNYLYWSNPSANIIGRVKLNGKSKNTSFIKPVHTGDSAVWGLARHGNYLYWSDYYGFSVGRSKLNGKGQNNYYFDIGSGSSPVGLLIAP
jgi:streptogramin lyase